MNTRNKNNRSRNKNYKSKNSSGNRSKRKPSNRGSQSKKTPPKNENVIDYSRYKPMPPKTYQVVFYPTFVAAIKDADAIRAMCTKSDFVNVVVKAEGDMTNPEILGIDPKVRLFAGEAWDLIHHRRIEEKWYESAN